MSAPELTVRRKEDDPCWMVVIDHDVFEVMDTSRQCKKIGTIEEKQTLAFVQERSECMVPSIPVWLLHIILDLIQEQEQEMVSELQSEKIEGPVDATEQGFRVDTTCYPNFAYKGDRFSPREGKRIFTNIETRALRLLRRIIVRENRLRKEVNYARRILDDIGKGSR